MINFQPAAIFSSFNEVLGGLSRDNFSQTEVAELGFKQLITQQQVHGTTINLVQPGHIPKTGDALITDVPYWLVGVLVADCAAILVYDPKQKLVASVHSGWRGSQAEILPKTIEQLNRLGSHPSDLLVYVSPMGQKCCYEVQSDFIGKFESKYLDRRHGKLYFDNQAVVRNQLAFSGVPATQTEFDPRCTIHDASLRSYRRDGQDAGRMIVAIGLKPM